MDLFTHASEQRMKSEAPLAARMRPHTLDEFVGQEANAVDRYHSAPSKRRC
jgi:putative ATPase